MSRNFQKLKILLVFSPKVTEKKLKINFDIIEIRLHNFVIDIDKKIYNYQKVKIDIFQENYSMFFRFSARLKTIILQPLSADYNSAKIYIKE